MLFAVGQPSPAPCQVLADKVTTCGPGLVSIRVPHGPGLVGCLCQGWSAPRGSRAGEYKSPPRPRAGGLPLSRSAPRGSRAGEHKSPPRPRAGGLPLSRSSQPPGLVSSGGLIHQGLVLVLSIWLWRTAILVSHLVGECRHTLFESVDLVDVRGAEHLELT